MNLKEVRIFIDQYTKGRFVSIQFKKELKPLKEFSDSEIVKQSSSIVRLGIKYDNITAVAMRRINGELPEVNSGLPWGQWKIPGYMIEHNGEYYLRIYTIRNIPIRAKYFLDGIRVPKERVEPMCQKSEFRRNNREVMECMTINIKNIERLGA